MPLRVTQTTDGKYVGLTMSLDPRNPPAQVATADGAVFDPMEWVEVEASKWRIRNPHYCVIAVEV